MFRYLKGVEPGCSGVTLRVLKFGVENNCLQERIGALDMGSSSS